MLSSQQSSLVGLAAPLIGPGEISPALSFVTGLEAPVPAGDLTFAIWLRDAGGADIVADPQVSGPYPRQHPDHLHAGMTG